MHLPRNVDKTEVPEVMGANQNPIKGTGTVTPDELKRLKKFYILGDYVVPYAFQ